MRGFRHFSFFSLFVIVIYISISSIGNSQNFDYKKAYQLYLQVLNGEKKFENLTTEEQEQVLIIRRIIANSSDDSGSEECRDAKEHARSAADELAHYAKRLKGCAENYDFSDDCSSEFRRTKNAFGEYESAVSDISSECE